MLMKLTLGRIYIIKTVAHFRRFFFLSSSLMALRLKQLLNQEKNDLDVWWKIFSDFLDGLVTREEVECLIDVSPENVNASKLFYQFGLEGGPVHDVVERTSFSKRDGLLSESHFNIIFSLSQVEPVQYGRQPRVEICTNFMRIWALELMVLLEDYKK